MSLFKVRQFWRTASEDDEYFDQNSLLVCKLNSSYDYVVSASQSGVLRVFNLCCEVGEDGSFSGFDPNDLVVEKIFDSPILQIASGKLVSGNQHTHLAVLHPKLVSVYSLESKTDHGNQMYLNLLYQHKFRKSAANFVIGPFGGSQNRDFMCVQSLDGLLSFFEQESDASHLNLPDFLLPGPLGYVLKTDSFLTVSSDWGIRVYKYKVLSEASDESSDPIYSKPKIFSEWFYNLGEPVIDIQVINDAINKDTWIFVLGERNLFHLSENGRLKAMKKLDYCPICMHVYVSDGKLFVIIIAETNMLLIYENTTLRWSAQLDCLPIAVHRGFFKKIKGALVLLTEEGHLECCYLGTEPSFFVAPPLNLQEIDFLKAEQELLDLEKVISDSYTSDVAQNNIEKDLKVSVTVSSEIEVCTYEHNIKNAASNYMCRIKIELIPQVLLQEVQVSVNVQRPLKVVPSIHFFSNISDNKDLFCYAFLDEAQDVPSLALEVKVSVITNLGVPYALTRTALLSPTLVLESCNPEKENKYKVTIATNRTPVGLATLFPEYGDQSASNSMAFKGASGNIGTILLAKSSERYRLQSDSFTMFSIILEQFASRLRRHFQGANDFKISFNSSLPSSEIFIYANVHFMAKQHVKQLQSNLSQLSCQFRLIQKRLLTKYRAKNPTSLKSLQLLLNDTYADILETANNLEQALENLSACQIHLSCALHLAKQLIDLLDIDDELLNMINSALCSRVYDLEGQAWEDVMDASLCHLLRTALAKTEKDRLRAPHTSFDEVKDLSKFEKHLNQVLERLSKQILKESDVASESSVLQNNTETAQELNQKPVGSQYGEFSSRLLSARKNLMRRHKFNEAVDKEGPI